MWPCIRCVWLRQNEKQLAMMMQLMQQCLCHWGSTGLIGCLGLKRRIDAQGGVVG